MTAPTILGGDYPGGFARWRQEVGGSSAEYLQEWGGRLARGPADDGLSDADRAEQLANAAEPAAAQTAPPALLPTQVHELYPALDWAEVWTRQGAPVQWICEPLIEAGRVVALYSPAKVGKSLLALELAAGLATGRPLLGNPAGPPLRVLYVDLENSVDDVRERLEAMGYGPDTDLTNLRYLSFPSLPALDSYTGGQHLHALAVHHAAQLVIVDTTGRVVSGDEDSADTYRALYRHAIVPLKAAGVAVLRLDHAGKDTSKGQRGSSGKTEAEDAVWELAKAGAGLLHLKRTHSRNNHGAERLTLARLTDPLRHSPGIRDEGLPEDVAEVVAVLDRLDVPDDYGRPRALKALVDAGCSRGNDLVGKAVAYRKHRAQQAPDLSGTGPDPDDLWTTPDTPQDSQEATP